MTHKERKSVSKESAARRDGRKMKKRMSLRREEECRKEREADGEADTERGR